MTQEVGRATAGRPARFPAVRPAVLATLLIAVGTTSLLGCSADADKIGAVAPVELGVSAPAVAVSSGSPSPSLTANDSPAAASLSVAPSPKAPAKVTPPKGAHAATSSRAPAVPKPAVSGTARSGTAARGAALARGRATLSPTPSVTATGPVLLLGPTAENSAEAEVVRLVNADRASAGCDAVTVDTTLVQLARAHSQDMSMTAGIRHNGSDGRTPFQRMMAAGYDYSVAAENIAAGQNTASGVMAAWTASPAHQTNIVDCRFTEIGVGVVSRPGTQYGVYWTQEFGTPM